MSSSLKWRPIIDHTDNTLPMALKCVLAKNGLIGSEAVRMTKADISYLRGLADGGVEGADELIQRIFEHETVEIYLEY